MAEPFIGEIRVFAGNYAPEGWALCNGQLLSIRQNTALFSILGTAYGGNGTTTFALPNLLGSAPVHQGTGQGLTPRNVGEAFGKPVVTLTVNNLPGHTHFAQATTAEGSTGNPMGSVFAETPSAGRHGAQEPMYGTTGNVSFNPQALASAGGNQAHNNMQPYLGLNFIIALEGVFPNRN